MPDLLKSIRYQLRAGVTDAEFLAASALLVDELATLDGFLARYLMHDGDRWVDVVRWRSRADADRSETMISTLPRCSACIALMNRDTITVEHLELVQATSRVD